MIPVERLTLKEDIGHGGKDYQRYALLDNLQLDERERTAVTIESQAVGGYLKAILEEGDAPREHNDTHQWPVAADTRLLEAQVTIPGQSHKDIAHEEQNYCFYSLNHIYYFLAAAKLHIFSDPRAIGEESS